MPKGRYERAPTHGEAIRAGMERARDHRNLRAVLQAGGSGSLRLQFVCARAFTAWGISYRPGDFVDPDEWPRTHRVSALLKRVENSFLAVVFAPVLEK